MTDAVQDLFRQLRDCPRCFGERRIFVPGGPPSTDSFPRILILGEQPAREAVQSKKTGIDLDPSRDRIREFLRKAEVDESDIFYSTSVLCVPRKKSRRGPRPDPAETKKCAFHVERLLQIVRPRMIVPLGHTSLQSLQWIYENWRELRQFILNYDVGNVLEKDDVAVYPLLHPSVHTLRLRSESRQVRDWQQIPEILSSLGDRTPTT
jgi:DNA polymerase